MFKKCQNMHSAYFAGVYQLLTKKLIKTLNFSFNSRYLCSKWNESSFSREWE